MKFFIPFVAAFAAVAVAAPATSEDAMMKRETVSVQNWMAELTSGVKQYTDSLNSIVASVPSGATKEQKKSAADSAVTEIHALTAFIHEANTKVAAAQKDQKSSSKRATDAKSKQPTLGDLPHDVLGQLNGQPIVLAKLLLPVLQELNPALESVLVTLSLGEVYVALQPLLKVELPGLVSGLGTLVNGLLAALSPLLASLGGLLGPLLLGLGL